MELESNERTNHNFVSPYQYPYYIWIGVVLIIGLVTYSLFDFPKYYESAKFFEKGKNLSSSGEDVAAVQLYFKAFKLTPSAENVKYEMAYSIFKSPRYKDKSKALIYLKGVKLDRAKWERLEKVIPEEYQQYFVTKKE